jgi:hypothetical protein
MVVEVGPEIEQFILEICARPEQQVIQIFASNGANELFHEGMRLGNVGDGLDFCHLQDPQINTDAFAPSIVVIGSQILAPAETLDVFNPFPEFESSVPLTDLQYSFCLLRESNGQRREKNLHRLPDDCDFRQQFAVSPRTYEDKTALILPLRGKMFVWEGHDFYAHHQRVPLSNSKVSSVLVLTVN